MLCNFVSLPKKPKLEHKIKIPSTAKRLLCSRELWKSDNSLMLKTILANKQSNSKFQELGWRSTVYCCLWGTWVGIWDTKNQSWINSRLHQALPLQCMKLQNYIHAKVCANKWMSLSTVSQWDAEKQILIRYKKSVQIAQSFHNTTNQWCSIRSEWHK